MLNRISKFRYVSTLLLITTAGYAYATGKHEHHHHEKHDYGQHHHMSAVGESAQDKTWMDTKTRQDFGNKKYIGEF